MARESCLSWLVQAFEHHGVQVVRSKHYAHIGPYGLPAEAWLSPRGDVYQLDVAVQWLDGRWIVESCTGFGDTKEAAARMAFANFLKNSFHVLFQVVCEGSCAHQVDVESWTVGAREYSACLGPVVLLSSSGEHPPAPAELADRVQAALSEDAIDPELAWIRVYYAQLGDERTILEVLLDGQPWEAGVAALKDLAWTRVEGFYSARFFMMLRDLKRVRDPMQRRVAQAILALSGRAQSREEVEDELRCRGVEADHIDPLVNFVPEALAHLVFGQLGVALPEGYVEVDADGGEGPRQLLQEHPIYSVAWAMGQGMLKDEAGYRRLRDGAHWSASHSGVSQLLRQGSEPTDLRLGDLKIRPGLSPSDPRTQAAEPPKQGLWNRHKRWTKG